MDKVVEVLTIRTLEEASKALDDYKEVLSILMVMEDQPVELMHRLSVDGMKLEDDIRLELECNNESLDH